MTIPYPGHYGPEVSTSYRHVLELIDRHIRDTPEHPALVVDGKTTTYGQLDHAADAVAAHLAHDHGVGRGDAVLVAARAGSDFTALVLGTLRCGAAFLPVDLSYPAERIAHIRRAAGARLFVYSGDEEPPEHADVTAAQLLAPPSMAAPVVQPDPADPAYVIFTSGSTGAPKGIVQTHRCLLNFVSWQVEDSGLGAGQRVLQFAPLSFDVSVQEIFSTLASGGCLYVPGAREHLDPRDLVQYLIDHDIAVVDFPQSLIDAIMTLPRNFRHVPSLRHLISAGETVRITPALEEMLRSRPEITMHNHYGPAENHMVAAHSMNATLDNLEPWPPVGSLVRNTYIRILDSHSKAVPDGEVGEIYIGGVGVAPGYTDPEQSAQVFGPDPFDPARRLYRTRDRGRWREDDTLELLGRIDDLIKVRGYSVEPREVEQRLRQKESVDDVAVFGHTRPDGAVELHAVLTGTPPPIPRLRAFILETLPDYMAPLRWWLAEELPLSEHGKLDRKALPGPLAQPYTTMRATN